jgi:DNA modification methylase
MGKIIQGDCLEVMCGLDLPENMVIITDPPYPDYYVDEYKYVDGILDFLKQFSCRQLIFWSAKVDFPLDYTAIHIWDKLLGVGSMYERIYERNGQKNFRVFRANPNSNRVSAQMNREVWTGHPSQKPQKLLKELISKYTKPNDTIIDPFCGSGSTLLAAKQLNRNYIGIEINPDYVKIAEDRLKQEVLL